MAPRVELEVLEHAELPLDEIGIAITRQSAWRAAGISAESRPRIIAEAVEDRTGKPAHEFAGLAFDSATNQGWEIAVTSITSTASTWCQPRRRRSLRRKNS